jgi:hypothetical protein
MEERCSFTSEILQLFHRIFLIDFFYFFPDLRPLFDALHREVLLFGHARGTEAGVDNDVLLPGPVLVVVGPDVLCPLVDETVALPLIIPTEFCKVVV